MSAPSPWIGLFIDAATLLATASIALVAHRFSKQQLALQMISAFMDAARSFETALTFQMSGIQELSENHMAQIEADGSAKRLCNTLLNQCEILCSCVVTGTIDASLTKRIAGPAIAKTYVILRPYITHLRTTLDAHGAWTNFETAAKTWGHSPNSPAHMAAAGARRHRE